MTLKQTKTESYISSPKTTSIADDLYALRKSFEAGYSALRSRKYEATRSFTIDLNHAIFEANQINSNATGEAAKIELLKKKLHALRQDLKMLFT